VLPKMTASAGKSAGSIRNASSSFEGIDPGKTAKSAAVQRAHRWP
jgi:hypothetical protein